MKKVIPDEEIIKIYNEIGAVRGTANVFGVSWHVVVKALSSNGYIINENHANIIDLYEKGFTQKEIVDKLKLNCNTVSAYIPRQKPKYGMAESYNAKVLKKFRERQKSKEGIL